MFGKLKAKLLNKWYSINDKKALRKIRKHYAVSVMNSEETIAYIKQNKCSIARYGDGEFELMLKTASEGYQKLSDHLADALKKVFHKASPQLLICIPYPMASTKDCRPGGKRFWNTWTLRMQKPVVTEIRQHIDKKYVFGDSFVSRPCTGFGSKIKSDAVFRQLKELWEDRDILIVEGEGTRMGVGNDLYDGAKSIKRILAPAENAFDVYEQIRDAVIQRWNGELVIMALGPTATVLAADLSQKGIQALDIGHLDIQYEWFLAGENYKAVANKYVNEVTGANTFEACEDPQYLSQIVMIVQNNNE